MSKALGKVKRDDVNMCMDAEHVCYVMKERYKSSNGRSSRTEGKLVTEKFLAVVVHKVGR